MVYKKIVYFAFDGDSDGANFYILHILFRESLSQYLYEYWLTINNVISQMGILDHINLIMKSTRDLYFEV